MPAAWAPACMDAEELAGWQAMNDRLSRGGERASSPCRDCPPSYADEMRPLGRCNGIPRGGAHEEEETRMDQPMAARAVERLRVDEATQTRVEVAVSAPCATCSHAPVCGLRETLVALTDVAVRLPRLDEAIIVRLAATATCGHYLRAPHPKRVSSPAQLAASREAAAKAREAMAAKRAKAAESVA